MMTRDESIVGLYRAGDSAQRIGELYGITPRQVQRIAKKAGVIRTISESFTIAIQQGRMTYHRLPAHLKKQRKTITTKLRYQTLAKHNYTCQACGRTPQDGIRIEIDHINGDATDNRLENLQVLCKQCNHGKAMIANMAGGVYSNLARRA